MAKWKEHGEVPDSDDDDLDLEDSQQTVPQTTKHTRGDDAVNSNAASAADNADDSLWDVPASSPVDSTPQRQTYRNAEPLPLTIYEIPSSPLSELAAEDFEDLSRAVQQDALALVSSHRPSPGERAPTEDTATATTTAARTEFPNELDSLTQAYDGGYRSLRPRKPIQEHPYVLENAQYSKLFKSHGVRPVKVAQAEAQEAQGKRGQDEDSQEQDYEDDSQLTIRNQDALLEDDSQPMDLDDIFDDLNNLTPPLLRDGDTSEDELAAGHDEPKSSRADEDEEDEFPDVADIEKWKPRKKARLGHQSTPRSTLKRPRLKFPAGLNPRKDSMTSRQPLSAFDVPPSPPQTSPAVHSRTPIADLSAKKKVQELTPRTISTLNSSCTQSPAPVETNFIIDLSASNRNGNLSDGESLTSGSESERNLDVVETVGRTIRGVLPASWLRLDQKHPKAINNKKTSGDRSPNRSPRKGVAQRRLVLGPSTAHAGIFFDDSDDSHDETILRSNENIPHKSYTFSKADDDAGSVVEEDIIDRMLPVSKRGDRSKQSGQKKRTVRSNKKSSHDESGQHLKQSKITGQLAGTPGSKQAKRPRHRSKSSHNRSVAGTSSKTSQKAPRLSVLDVIEPNAPPFMRIAARSARKRPDQGRSSPSHKHIALGTRKDNIDAMEVLSQWRIGKIQPRAFITSQRQCHTSATVHSTVSNEVQQSKEVQRMRGRKAPSASRFSLPRRQIQLSQVNQVTSQPVPVQQPHVRQPPRKNLKTNESLRAGVRPAMLETDSRGLGSKAFISSKRALDALFRRSRTDQPRLTASYLEMTIDNDAESRAPSCSPTPPIHDDLSWGTTRIARARKQTQPKWVDTAAPQYSHAHDPIPSRRTPEILSIEDESSSNHKLLGLGPFGTHYTHHFEVFPLDAGVFFHESTIIGSGRLARALDLHKQPRQSTAEHSFVLGERILLWNTWNAQVSSELGILLDWVVEDMSQHYQGADPPISTAAQGMLFVLQYVQDSLYLRVVDVQKPFLVRLLEAFDNFVTRIESLATLRDIPSSTVTSVLGAALVVLCHTLNTAQLSGLVAEASKLENLLIRAAKCSITILLRTNLSEVRDLYDVLQNSSSRDRGIREDNSTVICWVTVIQVLQSVRIPRSSFWDILVNIMIGKDIQSTVNSSVFERHWQNLFSLLPLGEFDSNGVVISGLRRFMPLEGWTVPQKLLGRIFDIYRSNTRQAPSFNDYFRALLGRCHYLAEQWGWRKASPVIGAVFDFFASQGLAHLRNEEAYKSPQFLEDLATSPSLAISAEDKCFHIFLKLLASTIRALTEAGQVKDVRNIVARVMPNHDRHFNKEMEMHQSDLAALRNHHDLLCTLFWAAPVDLRPTLQNIESLVSPGSSHKEACLVNLKAWSQLARFTVSHEKDITTYRPLASWMRNIAQQVLQQYISAETDVSQQYSRMPDEDSRSISRDFIEIVIKTNKRAALEVLGTSMAVILTTMQHCCQLNFATLVFSSFPIEAVFTQLQGQVTDSGWHCIGLGLEIVDLYLSLVKKDIFAKESQPEADCVWHSDEALEYLERNVLKYFFRAAKSHLGTSTESSVSSNRLQCLEHFVLVGGRLAACVTKAQLSAVSHFFSPGRHGFFPLPGDGGPECARKYLSLFLATLIANDIVGFQALKPPFTVLELLLCAIVKPYRYLKYENRLAAAVQSSGLSYLQKVSIRPESQPDYISNRDLFSSVTGNMRRTLQRAEPNNRASLKAEFAKAMRLVMDQIKSDLKIMTLDTQGQQGYVEFCRLIISLIRSQDFCPIDQFFYQFSQEYSPPKQDPRLQAAGILSYGLKLEEADPRAAPGLFFLLMTNFKIALSNGRVKEECSIMEQSMEHSHIFDFMLSRLLPAVISTAGRVVEAWLLLETYSQALINAIAAFTMYRNIGKEQMPAIICLLKCSISSIQHLARSDADSLKGEHLHSLTMMFRLFNALGPSIMVYLLMADYNGKAETDLVVELRSLISSITTFVMPAEAYLTGLIADKETTDNDNERSDIVLVPGFLFEGVESREYALQGEAGVQIKDFSQHISDDIGRNWISSGATVTVRGPSRPQGLPNTQTGRGVDVPEWDRMELVWNLLHELQKWGSKYGRLT